MRIAYGVMGYGRGHAMRSAAALAALAAEHEITVFAGGDAYEVLSPHFPTVRIPTLGYVYNDRGTYSVPRTLARNLAPLTDVLLAGAGREQVEREFRRRRIELVISDSEAWTHRAAMKLGLPRIGYDHVGIIAYCKPHFPPELRLAGARDAHAYRLLMGVPQRILISSFYPAEPAYPQVRLVGPMLREAVLRTKASEGEFLLAYFNKGEHQYSASLDRTLRQLERPVVIYGTPHRGVSDNLEFRAPSDEGFVRDLAACRAVIATAGSQLIGEAIHFGKPILALPEDAFEQRLNAWMVERLGIGLRGDRRRLAPADVDRFMGDYDRYRSNMSRQARDGRAEAIAALRQFIDELGGRRHGYRRAPRRTPAVAERAQRMALGA
ncbi:MAG: glycosyltransferase family protein [Sinobacteraceae bacterium]|nr:glycosyltransferase family protein [Nevskiaceae bacterium]